MKIALIGRGRVATNLLPALQKAGHEVVSVNSRTLEELPKEADVYIISVKDSALQEVINKATRNHEGQLFVHTAGSMAMDIFKGQATHYGVFYPMQTFSKERLVDFNTISLFLDTNDVASLARLKLFAATLTPPVYELDSAGRKHLHLAAVFACNFVNHCYALSAEVLEARGLPFSVMLPLVDETARKVHELAPKDAQTGPAVRGDQNVMQMQAAMLAEKPVVKQIYELLSNDIQRLADND